MIIHRNCRHFKGDIPCKPHKEKGVICGNCNYYSKVDKKILIIKLGAIGDVIRTTPLLHKIKNEYPNSEIYWLTCFVEVLPKLVDQPLNFDLKDVIYLKSLNFDLLINLDKDREACALANQIKAKAKKGFTLKNGKCSPLNKNAKHKWLTGIWDNLNKVNKKNYLEEIFEICGYRFNGEKYIFDCLESYRWDIVEPHPLIGLNTGCGERWKTRLWSLEKWVELARELKASGYGVILLGGKDEDEKNKIISKESCVTYLGHFSLKQFFSLVNQCDIVVTAVSMSLHIAIALNKKIILFNNIFNRNEFELYGLGKIIEPDLKCLGCFKQNFDEKCPVTNCMELITAQKIVESVSKLK
jgi:heptosyltransferase-2